MEKEKRRRSWLERIRRLFTSSEPKQQKAKAENMNKPPAAKSKRWLPGKLRTQHSFALPAPADAEQRSVRRQAEAEQSKHAMAVALATAAAAEAAVAAAHAAAEVVRLTGNQAASGKEEEEDEEERAAVAIQSAYRGYLARRALRALKGLVRLQALIRGQAVRRQTAATLRGLESLVRIQARNRSSRRSGGDEEEDDDAALLLPRRGREQYAAGAAAHEQEQQQNKGWDSSVFSKEEASAMSRSREEAAFKRLRALQYASIHNEKMGIPRRPPTSSKDEADQRWSWLDEWVGSHHHHQQHQPPFDKDVPVAHQSPYSSAKQTGDDRPLACSAARRSFVRPRRTPARAAADYHYYYYPDDTCSPAPAPATPGYMASTASAKAKFRSMSTPKERHAASDAFSEHCFPSAARTLLSPIPSMSPIPSVASDLGFAFAARRSPRVPAGKGPMTPARSRSRRSPGHHSFGSEAALHQLHMDHYTPVR